LIKGLSEGAVMVVLGGKAGLAELGRSAVIAAGAAVGVDVGARAAADCPESLGAVTGCGVWAVLDLLSAPYPR
jgi:hypothetical protein